ncbi:MAG: zf-HC2 domain-containing protein [Armatimonadota bacterium]|nr:zf-HC2 domain-containing protein [Armatimonadota bacterium]
MKKLSNNDLMDYLDGTLDAARQAEVEEHLKAHAEDAELVAEMKMAMVALKEWDEAEPVRVSEDFWPRLRDKLPERPRRSWLRGTLAQVGEWLRPAPARWGLSITAAVIAMLIALSSFWFAPEKATPQLSAEEKMFIQQSLNRHKAYVKSQPMGGAVSLPAGDERSAEHGENDDDDKGYTP